MIGPEWAAPMIGVALASSLQLAGLLIWGATLNQRVKTLEEDAKPTRQLSEAVFRLEERLNALVDQFRNLNDSVRWMRDPAEAPPPGPGRRARGQRRDEP